MTSPTQKSEREEALEAAERVVAAFAWAANYRPHRNRPERDAFHAARALLSSAKAEGEMREAVERACNEIEALQYGRRDAVLRLRAALTPKEGE